MKALSVKQPWASLIATGRKTVELRSWSTTHRGPLLICASRSPAYDDLPTGAALAIVEVVDCRPATLDDAGAACAVPPAGYFAWVLGSVIPLSVPFPVVGKCKFFNVALP
jgi:hypothetical protein